MVTGAFDFTPGSTLIGSESIQNCTKVAAVVSVETPGALNVHEPE